MGVYIKNWSLADWKELLKWAKIGANNAMIGEFTEVEEVPPHGDLIGRDELIENCMKEDGFLAELLFRKVSNAPTIIPASFENPTKNARYSQDNPAEEGE